MSRVGRDATATPNGHDELGLQRGGPAAVAWDLAPGFDNVMVGVGFRN